VRDIVGERGHRSPCRAAGEQALRPQDEDDNHDGVNDEGAEFWHVSYLPATSPMPSRIEARNGPVMLEVPPTVTTIKK